MEVNPKMPKHITEEIKQKIRDEYAAGKTYVEIQELYNVHPATIASALGTRGVRSHKEDPMDLTPEVKDAIHAIVDLFNQAANAEIKPFLKLVSNAHLDAIKVLEGITQ